MMQQDIEAGDIESGNIEAGDMEAVESPPTDIEAAQSTNSRSSNHEGCSCCCKGVLKTLLLLAVLIICALIAVVVYLYLMPCPVCTTPEMATCPPSTGASTSQNNTSTDITPQDDTEDKPLPQRFYDENYMR